MNKPLKVTTTPMPRTKQQIADLLHISYSTLKRRLRDIKWHGDGKLLHPSEQQEMLEQLGYHVDWVDHE